MKSENFEESLGHRESIEQTIDVALQQALKPTAEACANSVEKAQKAQADAAAWGEQYSPFRGGAVSANQTEFVAGGGIKKTESAPGHKT
jgi:hypothetical protein